MSLKVHYLLASPRQRDRENRSFADTMFQRMTWRCSHAWWRLEQEAKQQRGNDAKEKSA
jgi:hypothetical protein